MRYNTPDDIIFGGFLGMIKKLKNLKFDYTWVIIGICVLMIAVSLGFCSSGRSMYLTAITAALNIPRGAFSINDTIRFVSTTLVSLYFGSLVKRFGIKKLICAGFLCLIAFSLINAYGTKLYHFYIGGVFLGVGLAWTSTSMVSTIIHRWCTSNLGTITGATLAANGIGSAIAVQVLSPIIFQEGNPFGYRNSYNLVTLLLIITLVIILLFFREKPKHEEENGVIAPKKKKTRGAGWVGMDYSTTIKKPYFYLAIICIFCTGMMLQGLSGIAVPHMYDVGITVEFVALLSSISGILLTISKFGIGFMYDRFGMRITMNISYFCALFSLFGLVAVANTPLGMSIAFVRNIFSVLALPLETVMIPLFASELFGNKEFDKVLGVFIAANYAGYALGAPLGNLCYDFFGSYNVSFVVFGVLMIFASVAMQFVLSSANRDRKKILAAENEKEYATTQSNEITA